LWVTGAVQQVGKSADFTNGEIIGKRKYIRDFSTGNQQKTGIIGAIISNPEILFLDELFNFLDPTSQIIMKRLLQEYNRKYGTTVLLSSHNLQYVDTIEPSDAVKLEIEKYFENRLATSYS
jgi:ABC-2 type transport system ATP-binding protein